MLISKKQPNVRDPVKSACAFLAQRQSSGFVNRRLGFNSLGRLKHKHDLYWDKQQVSGSNPLVGSTKVEQIIYQAEVAERPIAPDCKSGARTGYGGSNPSLSTFENDRRGFRQEGGYKTSKS